MSNYIVGDPQGCFKELERLLTKVDFNPTIDTLWIAGDLVARGPNSLDVLRFAKDPANAVKVVLGNHDLHLLTVANGIHSINDKDNTRPILEAPDKIDLIEWLRHQPLMRQNNEFVLAHAGISPQWSEQQAMELAREVELQLQGEKWIELLTNMYADTPHYWSKQLTDMPRWRYIINAFTRMRFCAPDGSLDMACKLPPNQVSKEQLLPWFLVKQRVLLEKTIVFGHWAALDGYQNKHVIGLDTGCVWGGKLTMLRWEDKRFFTQQSLS